MRHLAKYMHDVVIQVTEIWCSADGPVLRDAVQDPEDSDCVDCLKAAEQFGKEASGQLRRLRQTLPRKGRAK